MSLKEKLVRQIAADGPMSLASYMQACLLDPTHGYYATRDPFGASGDFITAPEISQMFGELLGLSLAQAWLDQGAPSDFALAELGPGRGTLMRDMLRATKTVPGFAPKVHLVEASATLRAIQAETLDDADIIWHNDVSTLPQTPLFLVANEFFDALPIKQFIRQGRGWAERRVGAQGGQLTWGLAPPTPLPDLAHRLADTKDGDLIEICPAQPVITGEISERIAAHGGAAIIVDYGDWRSLGDTFQALQAHKSVDPLESPGAADLTAHVDFEAIATPATCAASKMIPQNQLLARLGIQHRAERLAQSLSGEALEAHMQAFHRLTSAEQMGTLFKAIALYPATKTPPPGFDP